MGRGRREYVATRSVVPQLVVPQLVVPQLIVRQLIVRQLIVQQFSGERGRDLVLSRRHPQVRPTSE